MSPRSGELAWVQVNRDRWEAPGAYIVRLWHKSEQKFYVSREGAYLGSDTSLERAKRRAQDRIRAPRHADLPLWERRAIEAGERAEARAKSAPTRRHRP